MSKVWRTALLTAIIAFAAAALGVYAGLALFAEGHGRGHASLDAVVHHQLNLSATQERQIATVEGRYATRKRSLEAQMRADTRELAAAVFEDKAYSDRVKQAIDHFHTTMGALQDETILHVFEMRAVLNPGQQAVFDVTVRAELLRSAGSAASD